MRKLLLLGLFGFAIPALASNLYVPRATRVRITNPSTSAITIDLGDSTFVLAPRELREVTGGDALMRIASSARVDVDAVREMERATATVPVLDASEAMESGVLAIGSDPAWDHGVTVINPNRERVTVTLNDASIEVGANAMERVPLHDVSSLTFRASRPVIVFGDDVNPRSGARVITRPRTNATSSKRRSVRSGEPPVIQPQPHTVTLLASKDATLYEIGNGSLANGAGVHLFTGTTATNSRRRALVAFDIASQIPAGSKVTSVTLKFSVNLSAGAAETLRLNPLTKDWGEGASDAGPSRDGGGTTARTGDATWVHTSFNTTRWTTAGGDFSATSDATASAGFADFTFGPVATLTARVQDWVDHPANNFGWIVLNNESRIRTAKRFDSAEAGATGPTLTVDFTN